MGRGRPKRENGETVTYVQIYTSVNKQLDEYCKENNLVKVRIVSEAIDLYLQENDK